MKIFSPTLFLFVFSSFLMANETPTYICYKINTPIKIDGEINDSAWGKIPYSSDFVDIQGTKPGVRKPTQKTNFKMCWDEKFLYIAAKMEETNIWGTITQHDSIIYQDNDFEVFIDDDSDGKNYIECEINALNTVWDLFLSAPYSDPNQIVLHDWDIKKLKTAVSYQGSLNNSSDKDLSWCVEIAIPWESINGHRELPRRGFPPINGSSMKMNFSRVGWEIEPDKSASSQYKKKINPETGKPFPETNDVWAATGEINIHMPEKWGKVIFSEELNPIIQKNYISPRNFQNKIHLWVHGNKKISNEDLEKKLSNFATAGIDCIIASGTPEEITRIAKLAPKYKLETIAWVWTMNQWENPKLKYATKEMFAISRSGKSCFEEKERPYVGYYTFFCPNQKSAKKYISEYLKSYIDIPNLSGIQLDYIRMPDVILPKGLWKNYNLIQNYEMPNFDFCYCETCKSLFKEKYGRELNTLKADSDIEWKQFRLDSIAQFANELITLCHKKHLSCGAAVFPTPEIASKLVRQNWKQFNLDFSFPMLYNVFYDEPSSWIIDCLKSSQVSINGKFPIYPGIHLPDVSPENLPILMTQILNTGKGIALFSDDSFSPEMQKALRLWKDKNRK